ncbi:MAG: fimbrillin family protein, partial [Duncaniella sp.]|nr:fimbrillin family protein [Duncaniella sp.]
MLNKLTLYVSVFVPLMGAMSACTSDSEATDAIDQGHGVTFTAREASRSTLISNSNITDNAFAVYGDMVLTSSASTATPTVAFDATRVTCTDGKWSYDNQQYWFPSHTYSFVALYPADANVSDINYQNSRLSFTYTYPDEYTQATDLLVANHRRRYTSSGTATPVAFDFRHLMARLDFVANVDPAIGNGSVTIHSISLRNVYTQATYTVLPAPTASQTDDWTT